MRAGRVSKGECVSRAGARPRQARRSIPGLVSSTRSVPGAAPSVTLPVAPALVAGVKQAAWLTADGEIALLPLAFGLFAYAAIFSLANAAMLAWRIRAEDRALANQERPV